MSQLTLIHIECWKVVAILPATGNMYQLMYLQVLPVLFQTTRLQHLKCCSLLLYRNHSLMELRFIVFSLSPSFVLNSSRHKFVCCKFPGVIYITLAAVSVRG